MTFRPDFTSKLVHELAFGTPKFYIAPYDKIKHGLHNTSSNCDVKSGLSTALHMNSLPGSWLNLFKRVQYHGVILGHSKFENLEICVLILCH